MVRSGKAHLRPWEEVLRDDRGSLAGHMMPLDTFNGTAGDDTYTGTSGDDTINGFAGNDMLSGGDGNDKIYGGDDNDVLNGGAGDDLLDAGTGNNTLNGGDGNDSLYSHGGVDTVDGGIGTNTWYGDYATSVVNIHYDQATGTLSNGTTIQNIEIVHLDTGYGNDRFKLDGSSSIYVDGGAGNDALSMDFSARDSHRYFSFDEGKSQDGGISGNVSGYGVTKFAGIESIKAIGSVKADSFAVHTFSAQASGSLNLEGGEGDDRFSFYNLSEAQLSKVSADGGANYDTLYINYGYDSARLTVSDDGSITTDSGHFSSFEGFYITLDGGSNEIDLGPSTSVYGTDYIMALKPGTNMITGSDGNDEITVSGNSNIIDGGAGYDSITSENSIDTIDGGADSDSWQGYYSAAGLTFDAANGHLSNGTSITNIEKVSLALSGANDIVELATDGVYNIFMNSTGGSVAVDMSGDAAGLVFTGTDHAELSFAQTQVTYGSAGAGSYVLSIEGTSHDDHFSFSAGFLADQKSISIDGGAGTNDFTGDFSSFSGVTFTVADDGSITSNHGSFANLQEFEITLNSGDNVVTTGALSDTIAVNPAAQGRNVLDGGAGNDTIASGGGDDLLRGSDGNDILTGNGGNDVLNGGNGNDILDGGIGNDTASYRGATVGVHVAIVSGQQDTIGAGLDLLSSIENLTGSSFDDKLTGDGGANTLIGAQGDDRLFGGAGNDVLEGDAGKDQLTGGAGADRFVFAALTDFDPKGPDKITDFSHADGDIIDLSAIDPDPSKAGDQSFTFIGSAAFSKGGTDYELRVVDKGNGTYVVQGDVNHDGHTDFSFVVDAPSHIHLVAADFHL